jgi:hypothetical protein
LLAHHLAVAKPGSGSRGLKPAVRIQDRDKDQAWSWRVKSLGTETGTGAARSGGQNGTADPVSWSLDRRRPQQDHRRKIRRPETQEELRAGQIHEAKNFRLKEKDSKQEP